MVQEIHAYNNCVIRKLSKLNLVYSQNFQQGLSSNSKAAALVALFETLHCLGL